MKFQPDHIDPVPETVKIYPPKQTNLPTESNQFSMIPTITLEEHFVSAAEEAATGQPPAIELYDGATLWRKLRGLGDERIKDMNEGGVTFQVISHNAGYNASDAAVCRKSNDELNQAITKHPTRFAGFATLPMADATAATEELERCVKELGFLGALVCNHARGEFYDGKKISSILRQATRT